MAPRGSRVLLRLLQAEDASEIVRLVRASRTLHGSWVHPPGDRAAFRSYLRRSRQETVRTLVVVRREDGAIVGLVSLSQIFLGNFRSAYLGYWVGAPYAGRGYMREGMELLLSACPVRETRAGQSQISTWTCTSRCSGPPPTKIAPEVGVASE